MDAHRIHGLPPSAWYIEEFITEAEEEYLLKKVRSDSHSSWRDLLTVRSCFVAFLALSIGSTFPLRSLGSPHRYPTISSHLPLAPIRQIAESPVPRWKTTPTGRRYVPSSALLLYQC